MTWSDYAEHIQTLTESSLIQKKAKKREKKIVTLFFFKNTDKLLRDMKELIITKWGQAASQRGKYHNKLLHY